MRALLVALLLTIPVGAGATVLFSDDFDDHSDWSPTQQNAAGGTTQAQDGNATTACTGCPDGAAKYSGYYVAHSAWTDYVGDNTLSISATNARGGTGKALTLTMEPIDACTDNGGYCSDGQLVVSLDSNYDDVYVRYYIKFEPNWVLDETNNNVSGKMMHITNFHSTPGSMWTFFCQTNASHWPIVVWNLKWPVMGGGGSREVIQYSPRYQNVYYPNQATPAWALGSYEDLYVHSDWSIDGTAGGSDKTLLNHIMDGNWHEIIVRVKGNTAGGYYAGTANGIFEMWVDEGTAEEVHYQDTTLAWADGADADACGDFSGSTTFNGWNWVSFGGNFLNRYYSAATQAEQFYVIDDIVIATTLAEVQSTPAASSSTTIGSGTPVTIGSGTTVTIQ